jgi:hypothetical protein
MFEVYNIRQRLTLQFSVLIRNCEFLLANELVEFTFDSVYISRMESWPGLRLLKSNIFDPGY